MSKGSNRRPGSGYADGWSRIFGNANKDYQIEVAGDTVFGLDPAKTYRTEVAKDGSVSYWEEQDRKNHETRTLLDAMPVANECPPTGVYAIKVGQGITITLPQQTCQHCKYYVKEYSWFECINKEVVSMAKADYGPSFEPPADFGCNKFERKL